MTIGLRSTTHEWGELSTPPRDQWFRIEEREKKSVPCPPLEIGDTIYAKRVIFRAGYWLEHQDMPRDELNHLTYLHITNTLNKCVSDEVTDLAAVLAKLAYSNLSNLFATRPHLDIDSQHDGPFPPACVPDLWRAFGLDEETAFKSIEYQVRRRWLRKEKEEKKHPHQTNLKTFWYYQRPDMRPIHCYIEGKKRIRQVGEYYSSSGGWTGDDYDPPYLYAWMAQGLYHVGHTNPWGPGKRQMLFVHPMDVVTEHE